MKRHWPGLTPSDVRIEAEQLEDEGRDISSVKAGFDALGAADVGAGSGDDPEFQAKAAAILDVSRELPTLDGYGYSEPNELDAIRAARPDGPRKLPASLSEAMLADRIHGAWLGRCAGCLLGKPVEGVTSEGIRGIVESAGSDMIDDYLWRMKPSAEACEKAKRPGLREYGDRIDAMPRDDDTDYTIVGLSIMQQHGLDFEPEDVASFWLSNLPIMQIFTAERIAYRNFVSGVLPPASAERRNPCREWIGAQIRADAFGYVGLGSPELAAELAFRDASISHVKNGIYGEMWVAAMLAAAASELEIDELIEVGLSEIPSRSRLTSAIREVMEWRSAGLGYEAVCGKIHQRWDETNFHHWCHTISNAQIVAIGLLWGDGEYESSIVRAVYPGFDTDCNGATVGSIIGMRLGARGIPAKWSSVLNDAVETALFGRQRVSISGSAAELFELQRVAADRKA